MNFSCLYMNEVKQGAVLNSVLLSVYTENILELWSGTDITHVTSLLEH